MWDRPGTHHPETQQHCTPPGTGLSKFLFFRQPASWLKSVGRLLLELFVLLLGTLQRMWLLPAAPLLPSEDGAQGRPVIVFSHGLAGFRSMYSVPCAELASQGYVVLAVEHCDGSSSAARLAQSVQACGLSSGLLIL